MKIEILADKIILCPSKVIYSQEILFKCFYWYGADFEVSIDNHDSDHYLVELVPKDPNILQAEIITKIKRDLADYKLREIVTKETLVIRELLVAKAFAYDETDNDFPDSEITDPVGFDPLQVSHG